MATSISRRTVLAAGAGAAVGLSLPGAVVHAGGSSATNVRFRLDAQVLDGGEQVTSVTLDTARLGPIDPASLTTGTFTVHARATSPIALAAGDPISGVRSRPPGDGGPARPRQHRARPQPRRGPGRRRHARLHREQGPQRAARPRLHHHSARPVIAAHIAVRSPSRVSCRAGCPTPRWTRSATASRARE